MNAQPTLRKRDIINKRGIRAALDAAAQDKSRDALRTHLLSVLKEANIKGQDALRAMAALPETNGRTLVHAHSYLMDQLIALGWETIVEDIAPLSNPTQAERLAIVAVGGYGREEMAPFSDVDLLFLTPYKITPWSETAIEHLLYLLWDMGLKVGHATRSISEMMSMARQDITVRTAFLEARLLQGDGPTFAQAKARFETDIIAPTKADFIEQKLEEREIRHARMGDSRFVVEPNIKEGKGGLRDLQSLYWIAKYVYGVEEIKELVGQGVFTANEYRSFRQAETFLWNVRCHLHYLAGRAEERLTFSVQPELAAALHYTEDRAGLSGVERFMKHYFLMVKRVGDLTHIFIAHLAQTHRKKPLIRLPRLRKSTEALDGLEVIDRWLKAPDEAYFEETPQRLLTIFAAMDKTQRDIHPDTLRVLRRAHKKVDRKLRRDPKANEAFLTCLTSKKDPERVLRRMNETGIFGRFIPDFGKVVAQMQFDMYHHYTVDEHTIRAVSLLSQIERGLLADEHPISTKLMPKVVMRRALYVAVLLHDIAKGRGGNHSILGAQIAKKLCPRLGMSPAETETVAWLVRYHLLMSHFAFKRDLSDPKTVSDFVADVKSPERLRLLILLTVVDIRAVGPKVWNAWKGQLLTDLYHAAEEQLVAGHATTDHAARTAARKAAIRARLSDWSDDAFDRFASRLDSAYWLSEPDDLIVSNALLLDKAGDEQGLVDCKWSSRPSEDVTYFTVHAADHPGIFYRIAGALCLGGATIAGAKIHTTSDGMALDNFLLQNADGGPFDDEMRLKRTHDKVLQALKGKLRLTELLAQPLTLRRNVDHFDVEPVVLIDNAASNRFTVIEVNALDRPALLYRITRVLFHAKVSVRSAHVATYGERAVDVFYVTDLLGQKITNTNRVRALERRILEALQAVESAAKAA
ncbi:MAG: [protein-PII] uridylyltransferase [Pseudomonadota bacterium]